MVAAARVCATDARRLFMGAQGLLDDPARRAGPAAVQALIDRLGFVQLDSINVVARAHDLTLASRLDGYRPGHLAHLLERGRSCFEHWTHDASAIPTALFPHWKPRFRRDAARLRESAWMSWRLGEGADGVIEHVRERVAREGPLMSADFEHPSRREAWWGWKPQKAALDYLWRSGELLVRGRVNFHKVYDLAERVLPEQHAASEPEVEEHREWACSSAAERLVVFTARELASYWNEIDLKSATLWCANAREAGRVEPVSVESADGSGRQAAFALGDWRVRLARLPPTPERIRLLSPFDPVMRDRARALRRFGFDFRFEAFVPPAKRRYGYYVLPILDGDELVGRLNPKLHRERGVLEIRGLWWEPKVKVTRVRERRLRDALERMSDFLGAKDIHLRTKAG